MSREMAPWWRLGPGFSAMKTVKFSDVVENATNRKCELVKAGKLRSDVDLRNNGKNRTPAKRVLLKRAEARAKRAGLPVIVGYT
jgi:hypothetical protein